MTDSRKAADELFGLEQQALTSDQLFGLPDNDASPASRAADGLFGRPADKLRGTFELASGRQPEQVADELRLQKATGLPMDVVQRNRDDIRKQVEADGIDYAAITSRNPALANWLNNVDNAALSRNDIGALTRIADLARSVPAGVVRDLFGQGLSGIGEIQRASQRMVSRGLRNVGADPLADAYEQMVSVANVMMPLGAEQFHVAGDALTTAGEFIAPPVERQNFGTDVAAGLGQVAGQITLAIVSGGTAPLLLAAGQGAQTQAERAEEAKKSGELESDLAVFGGAAITPVLEKLGLWGIINRLPSKVKGDVMRRFADVAAAGGIEAATEAAENVAQNLLTQAAINPDMPIFDGTGEAAAVGGTVGALARAGIDLILPGRQSIRAREHGKTFSELDDAADAVKMRDMSPDKAAEAFDAILAQEGKQEVFMPVAQWNALFQSQGIDPAQAYADMGGEVVAYQEAAATISDLRIPYAKYLAKLAPETRKALTPHLRLTPDDMTTVEAEDFAQQAPQIAEQLRAAGLETEAAQTSEAYDFIYNDMLGQLMGRYSQADAERMAAAEATRFVSASQNYGGDALEAYRQIRGISTAVPESLRARAADSSIDPIIDRYLSGDIPTARDVYGPSLVEFLRERGGVVDTGGDLRAMDVDASLAPFQRRLVTEDGASLDDALQFAREAGYFPELSDNPDAPTEFSINDLLDAIGAEMGGQPRYAPGNTDVALEGIMQGVDQLTRMMDSAGIDTSMLDRDAIRRFVTTGIAPDQVVSGDQVLGQALPATIDIDGVQRSTVNSNGQPLAQTEEGVRSFWRWFGDSRVVDSEGRPLVVYHGTPSDFDAFSGAFLGKVTRSTSSKSGFFFASTPRTAQSYADHGATVAPVQELIEKADKAGERGDWDKYDALMLEAEQLEASMVGDGMARGQNIMPVYLSIQKPLEIDAAGENPEGVGGIDPLIKRAQRAKNDGVSIRNFDDAAGLYNELADHFIAFDPTQIKSATGNRGTFDPNDPSILYQPAYHGSPYRFDKFTLDAIGTGEGAQAYGWGLYFAGKREIAEFYRETLSGGMNRMLDNNPKSGVLLQDKSGSGDWSIGLLNNEGTQRGQTSLSSRSIAGETFATIQEAVEFAKANGMFPDNVAFAKYDSDKGTFVPVDSLDEVDTYDQIAAYEKGQLYRVEIPEDDQFLLWDKSLSEQPEKVREALASFDIEVDGPRLRSNGVDYDFDKVVGEGIYGYLTDIFGSAKSASLALRDAGIAGIKYLDGMSRGGTGDSYNYVVFDDQAVQIAETFYQSNPFEGKRGALAIFRNAQGKQWYNVLLLEKANRSTFIHEMGHYWLERLGELATGEQGTDLARDDYQKLLDWFGVKSREDIREEHHEMFARANEAYVMEGKAPSAGLRGVFARFRRWMLGVYGDMRRLDVNLTDDVRSVFDRLYATEAEIASAKNQQAVNPIFTSQQEAGMTNEQWSRYLEDWESTRIAAENELAAEALEPLRREERAWWKDEREKARDEVTDALHKRKDFIAVSALRNGRMPDGRPLPAGMDGIKISKDSLANDFQWPQETINRLPRGIYSRKGGMSVSAVADLMGYPNGNALLDDMLNYPKDVDAYIRDLTEARLKEKFPDLVENGTLGAEAMKVIHTERTTELLLREANKIGELISGPESNGLRRHQLSMQMVRAAARKVVDSLPVKDLNPNKWRQAERRAGTTAFNAAKAGNLEEAMRQKRAQALNHEMYRIAVKARDNADKIAERQKRYDKKAVREKIGKAGKDYLEQIDALREQFEFRYASNRDIERTESLRQFLARMEAEGRQHAVPQEVIDASEVRNYREIPYGLLVQVDEAITSIAKMAEWKTDLIIGGKKRELDAVVSDLNEQIIETGNDARTSGTRTSLENYGRFGRNVLNTLLWPDTIMREIDGFKDSGPFQRYIFDPLSAAIRTKLEPRLRQSREALAEVIGRHWTPEQLKANTGPATRFYIDELGTSWTHSDVISLALNWGNAGNREAVTDGLYGPDGYKQKLMTPELVKRLLDRMDKKDWLLVRDMAAYVDTFWPEIAAKQKERTGIQPEKVEATADGLLASYAAQFNIDLPGWYWPLKYDSDASAATMLNEADEQFKDLTTGKFGSAQTKRGHTIERVGSGGRPVRIDFNVAFNHVSQVVRDLTIGDDVTSAWQALNDGRVQQTMIAMDRKNELEVLKVWLKDVASGELVSAGSWATVFQRLRTGFTVSVLGLQVSTSLLNVTGYVQSSAAMGRKYAAAGLRQLMSSEWRGENSVTNQIMEMSPYMRSRWESGAFNKDVMNTLDTLSGPISSRVSRVAFWMMMKTQVLVDTPTWLGAMQKAKDLGLDGDEARDYADRWIDRAQSGGLFALRSGLERGTISSDQRQVEGYRFMTTLMSYMIAKGQIIYEKTRTTQWKDPSSVMKWTGDMFMLLTVEAMLVALVRMEWPDDEDDDGLLDDFLKKAAGETAMSAIGVIPGVSQFSGTFKGFDGGVSLNQVYERFGAAYTQAAQGEADLALFKSLNNLGGLLLRYPSSATNRIMDAAWRQAEGEDVSPLEYIMRVPQE